MEAFKFNKGGGMMENLIELFSESNLKKLADCKNAEQVNEIVNDVRQNNIAKEIFELKEKQNEQ